MIRIPKTKRGIVSYIFAIFITTFTIFSASNTTPIRKVYSPSPSPIAKGKTQAVLSEAADTHFVKRVIDGDTFVIETDEKVRLIGINSPESVSPKKGIECFGRESSLYLTNLILNKEITLTRDVSNKDSFGRLLRYAYIGEIFVNKHLVEEGYAQVSTYPPDVKYLNQLKEAQTNAFVSQKGLWKKCN